MCSGLQTKTHGTQEEYPIPIVALSDAELQIEGRLPILTGKSRQLHRMVYKYTPLPTVGLTIR